MHGRTCTLTHTRTHTRRVGSANITEATPELQRHMHLDWCTLFKSEMFVWLNRYLTMGMLPSNKVRARAGVCLPWWMGVMAGGMMAGMVMG